MKIDPILLQIKKDFEQSVTTAQFNGRTYANGNKAKEALIRSQKIINLIHEFVKGEFVKCGVPKKLILPPLGRSNPEMRIKGFLKSKKQDVSIIPNGYKPSSANTFLASNEKILSINIRSQLSSLSKNIDTLYERTFAEALNLHLSYPRQCLGEVYLIPTNEYNDKATFNNVIAHKKVSKIEDYIRMFQAINNRRETNKDGYKYERVCLLIVDFSKKKPKLYSAIEELKKDGFVAKDSVANLENLSMNNFAKDLLTIYRDRFNQNF